MTVHTLSPYRLTSQCDLLVAALAACFSLPVAAQTLDTIVVTGNPLGRDNLAQPSSVVAGDGLLLRQASTLGETLNGLPGVAGSGFGPNSSRPVIRGLDGDRVRLLDNGGATIDASNLSFDHAVAQDTLVTERIELLRGPAALLYGGNATGGVVNSIDNRIPRRAQAGLAARSEVRLGGAAVERSAALVLDGGLGRWAWHADAFGRRSSDLQTPRFVPMQDGQALDSSNRVRNSASRAEGGALGGGLVGADGHLGMALDTYRSDYGVTVEPDVLIRMQRSRLSIGGEQRRLEGLFDNLSFSASHTRYHHQEVEGSGEIGSTFNSRGQELRLQARHVALGPMRGVLGMQLERLRFSALGEEAFVPDTRTRSQALFVLEEAAFGAWRLQAGARSERVHVTSAGDLLTDHAAEAGRFGPSQQRRFSPTSVSLGAHWRGPSAWAAGLTAGHTERAPAYYELFANGVHVATAAYERGDAGLGLERSRHLGATLEWRSDSHQVKASVYATRFSNYIALSASGNEIPIDEGGSVPEYRFEGVRALLKGYELEARWRVAERPWRLDLSAQAEAVRGDDLSRGEPLPRMAPRRLQLGLELASDRWMMGLGVRQVSRQTRVPANDSATPGHAVVNAWASWRLPVPGDALMAFVRLDNLGDRLAYNATAVSTIRGLSPQGGRAVMAGLRLHM